MRGNKAIKETRFMRVLREAMYSKKLSQMDLAIALGVRQSQVSNWLNGRSLPNYTSIQVIKDKLGIAIEQMFD